MSHSTKSAGYVSEANSGALHNDPGYEWAGTLEDVSQFASVTVFVTVHPAQSAELSLDFTTDFTGEHLQTVTRQITSPPTSFNVFTVLSRCVKVRVRAVTRVDGYVQTLIHRDKNNQWPEALSGQPTGYDTPASLTKSILLTRDKTLGYSQVPTAPGGGGALVNMDQEPNNFTAVLYWDASQCPDDLLQAGGTGLTVQNGTVTGGAIFCNPTFQARVRFSAALSQSSVVGGGSVEEGAFFGQDDDGVFVRCVRGGRLGAWQLDIPDAPFPLTLTLDGEQYQVDNPRNLCTMDLKTWRVQCDTELPTTFYLKQQTPQDTPGAFSTSSGRLRQLQAGITPSVHSVSQTHWSADKANGAHVLPACDFSVLQTFQIITVGAHVAYYIQSSRDGAFVKVHGTTQEKPQTVTSAFLSAGSAPLKLSYIGLELEGYDPSWSPLGQHHVTAQMCGTVHKKTRTPLLAVRNPIESRYSLHMHHLRATFVGTSTLKLTLWRCPQFAAPVAWRRQSRCQVTTAPAALQTFPGGEADAWHLPPQAHALCVDFPHTTSKAAAHVLQPGEWLAICAEPCFGRNLVGSELCLVCGLK